jgi:hydrogenase nickel incorporation protein HypB
MFTVCDALVVNKVDYLAIADFDMTVLRERVLRLNPRIRIFEVSCKTGEGIVAWIRWLREEVETFQKQQGEEHGRL